MVMGPISPIIRSGITGRPILIGGQPVHYDPQGRVRAIGSQPIYTDLAGRSHLLGGGAVHHDSNPKTSDEVGGLPVTRDLSGRPNTVVGPRIGPTLIPPRPTEPAASDHRG